MLGKEFKVWQCGGVELNLARPKIMGILNVTPDSFSDGGQFVDSHQAIEHAFALLDQGADIIDVGGESTRPGFTPVSPEEEASRVVPVVRELVQAGALVSVDTRHAEVARMCVRLGAQIVNDVTGFSDPAMVEVASQSGVGCIVMHAGTLDSPPVRKRVSLDSAPETKHSTDNAKAESFDEVMKNAQGAYATSKQAHLRRHSLPEQAPIMRQVMGFLSDKARLLMRSGVARERICIDPGTGFGKQAEEDLVIQRSYDKLASMGYPVMCAVSRKRMAGALSGITVPIDRDIVTAGLSIAAIAQGANIVRVHNVKDAFEAISGYVLGSKNDERKAYIALGSNIGNSKGYLAQAIQKINELPFTCVTHTSKVYQTAPALGLSNSVLNCVIEVKTQLLPLVLINYLLGIEAQLERVRSQDGICTARTIDCDLLWMEGEIHAGNKLVLPHPGIGKRDFVIEPLSDLMSDPIRFLTHQNIVVYDKQYRIGAVEKELGHIAWSEGGLDEC